MHDEMLAIFDDCLSRLTHLRDDLGAARPVHLGQRRLAVEEAISAAETFANRASTLLEQSRPSAVPV